MNHFKFFKGYGCDDFELVAFDKALQDAGIGDYNIVKVSSILPPNCAESKLINLATGSVLYTAYSKMILRPNEYGSTAVAYATPKDSSLNGVIFETSSRNVQDNVEINVQEMCKKAMMNRNREIDKIFSKSMKVTNATGKYCAIITGIAMW